MSEPTVTDFASTLNFFADLGFTFTLARPGEKAPFKKGWQLNPEPAPAAQRHLDAGGNVGVLLIAGLYALHEWQCWWDDHARRPPRRRFRDWRWPDGE